MAVMPDMRPSKLMHEDKDGVQVWGVIDAKGNDVCTIVRYLRSYPSHIRYGLPAALHMLFFSTILILCA